MISGAATEPLLAAHDLRVDVDGVAACDGLTFTTAGAHVLVLGAPRVLFDAAIGVARVDRGTLAVRGMPASHASSAGAVAGAAMDPPTPPRWTVLEYVTWSARLSGASPADARASARAAVDKMKLGPLAATPMSKLVSHARRGAVAASALVTGAPVIALDDPLAGLPEDAALAYAEVLVEALSDRAWVVFAARVPLGSPLARAADEAIVVRGDRVEVQGRPAEIAAAPSACRRFALRVHGSFDAIAPLVEARGARVERQGARIVLDLGDAMTTSELMALCDRADVAIVELVPFAAAFS